MCCSLVLNVIFVVISLVTICFAQKLNEKCKLNDGTSGYCTNINKCSAKSIYLLNTINSNNSNLCNSGDSYKLICCPFHNVARLRNSKSTQKCLEYLNFNENKRYARNIAGGYRAVPGEFAHLAALGYIIQNKIEWHCGGTLISEQYVLTAAHCLKTKIGTVKFVRLGDLDLYSDEDMVTPQTFEAKELIAYPQFDRKNKYNDIGLIKLNQSAQFGMHVFPACLYVNKKIVYDSLTAIGWGSINLDSDKSKSLMKVDLNVFSAQKCKKFYYFEYGYNILSNRQFCAVGNHDVRDTCQGASGSPLLVPTYLSKKVHYAVGIVSFGPKCGEINTPGIYTKIGYYVSWIESVVWPNT